GSAGSFVFHHITLNHSVSRASVARNQNEAESRLSFRLAPEALPRLTDGRNLTQVDGTAHRPNLAQMARVSSADMRSWNSPCRSTPSPKSNSDEINSGPIPLTPSVRRPNSERSGGTTGVMTSSPKR